MPESNRSRNEPNVKAPTSPRLYDPESVAVWAAVAPIARHMEKLRRSYYMNDYEFGTFDKHIIIEMYAILDGSRTEPNGCIYVWNVAKSLADICRKYQQDRESPIGPRVLGLLWWAGQSERQRRRA